MEKITGQKIKRVNTLGSWYDNNSIAVVLDTGEICRLNAQIILQMANEFTFELNKARKYRYLEKPELIKEA